MNPYCLRSLRPIAACVANTPKSQITKITTNERPPEVLNLPHGLSTPAFSCCLKILLKSPAHSQGAVN
ncbi:UNVERIFIED_CONTAM: hypothetical protein Sradi_3198500 [Sesamum radiatum]|uniref:Uncharacterized protein n=1 Tax=Sesamum radiatum TaxID=300843 RepID=A0AAW2RF21_SESRA